MSRPPEAVSDEIRTGRGPLLLGARAVLPLAMGTFPFGVVYGAVVVELAFPDAVGMLASPLVFAGAAQLALVELLDQGTPWVVALLTALVINLRLVMYSGALAPAFARFPRRWRVPLAYFMTDQVAVTALLYFEGEPVALRRMRFYLGAGLTFLLAWTSGTMAGVLLGATIPPELQLTFAIPLMFLALLIPSIRDRAGVVAAATGLAVTVLARDAPLNTGLLIGAAAGIAFGLLAKKR